MAVKLCKYCNKEYTLHHSGQKYCSPECCYKAQRKRHTKYMTTAGVLRICKVCGKEFNVPPRGKKRVAKHLFCSAKCHGTFDSLKGRKTKTISKSCLDKVWSTVVRSIAGNKCELCGSSEHLNAHHLIGRKNHATRWYIPNGVCLCVKHHWCGNESAHQNSLWFIKEMIALRGQEWLDDVLTKSKEIFQWKKHAQEIKDYLYERKTNECNNSKT